MQETGGMRNRWPILALLCVLASLLVPGIASAHSAEGAENRVWAFDLADQVHVAGQRALTPESHQGCELAEYDFASDSPLAAKGGGRVNKVGPTEGAGPHTGFKRDPQTGKVTGYTEFDGAGNPVKRFRGEGKPHGGVDPPLVLEPKPGKGPGSPPNRARPARPDEIPGGGQ